MDVAKLERQLAEYWQASSSGSAAVVRARSANLVIVCRDRDDLTPVTETVAALAEIHPGRTLTVVADADAADDGLSAQVALHCNRSDGEARVFSEQIDLEARGAGVEWLPQTVLQLLVGDCPVYTWWRSELEPDDPRWPALAGLSNRFVVDSALAASPGATLSGLLQLAGRDIRVGDLQWIRLRPWAELVASQFDPAVATPYLQQVSAIEVHGAGTPTAGNSVAGAYLAGWLAGRLGWEVRGADELQRRDGARVSLRCTHDPAGVPGEPTMVRIVCAGGDPAATFTAERLGLATPAVRLRMDVEHACPLPYIGRLERTEDSALLCREIERTGRDPLFIESLTGAVRLLA